MIKNETYDGYTKMIKICSLCVMDESDSDISFNESGVCNHCVEASIHLTKYIDLKPRNSAIEASEFQKVKNQKENTTA